MTFSSRKFYARIFEQERQEETARKAAIEAALAKPPPPEVSPGKLDPLEQVRMVALSGKAATGLLNLRPRNRH